MRGLLTPTFWPKKNMQSVCSKSSIFTVPIGTPMVSGGATDVLSCTYSRCRAADTLKARRLVLVQERYRADKRPALAEEDLTHRTRRAPASDWTPIGLDCAARRHLHLQISRPSRSATPNNRRNC